MTVVRHVRGGWPPGLIFFFVGAGKKLRPSEAEKRKMGTVSEVFFPRGNHVSHCFRPRNGACLESCRRLSHHSCCHIFPHWRFCTEFSCFECWCDEVFPILDSQKGLVQERRLSTWYYWFMLHVPGQQPHDLGYRLFFLQKPSSQVKGALRVKARRRLRRAIEWRFSDFRA